MFIGPYWWLLLPGIALGLWAHFKLRTTYAHYLQEPVGSGLSGAQAARAVLDQAGLQDVPIEMVAGELTDHYDPMKQALFLSESNYRGRSLAAVGVAAHEAGHALQHQAAYAPLKWRMMLVPATNFASTAVYFILGFGFLLMWLGHFGQSLFVALLPWAIGAYGVITLFQLITLPVEYDASRRAKIQLFRLGIVQADEREGVNHVLNAAALTYVAALVAALLQMLQLILIARGFSNR